MTDDVGRSLDRLHKHIMGAARPDVLSKPFSICVYDELKDQHSDDELRPALWEDWLPVSTRYGVAAR